MIFRLRTLARHATLVCLILIAALLAVPVRAQTAAPTAVYTQDDVLNVASLDLMEGHLRVSLQLWTLQQYDLAATHAGHPVEELYATVADWLKTAGMDQKLTDAIKAYSAVAGKTGDTTRVQTANKGLVDTIHAAQQAIVSAQITANPAFQGEVIRHVLDVASGEYADATTEQGTDQLIDYQDSDGFVSVASDRYQAIHGTVNADSDKIISAQFAAFAPVYPDLMKPPAPLVEADAYKHIADTIGDTLTTSLNLPADTYRNVDRAIDAAKAGIAQALDAYKHGDASKAYNLAASAYLDNFEGLEGDLAKLDSTLLATVEGQFKQLRDGIQANKPLADLMTLAQAIDANLDTVEQLLTSVNPASMSMGTPAAN